MAEGIVNRVANSALVSIDLEELYQPGERVLLDIKDQLFQGLILREKDFREYVKNHDWQQYEGEFVAITCTADAIVPTWAFMLLASKLEPVAKHFVFGDLEALETKLFTDAIAQLNLDDYTDKPVVIKGCSDKPVPVSAYVELVRVLRPKVRTIMYGEPCSTVPVYKKPRK
ncbi:DUF2480 family protein [Flammeovirgaceae bacterium SG7u.111]|nr:DUF2480 family protein [Flammeovirgaceae bacterium SG7u.132]WPO36876.1 DUF2480 family protein [Flammeovirgaceae bacterium SG7u.111]